MELIHRRYFVCILLTVLSIIQTSRALLRTDHQNNSTFLIAPDVADLDDIKIFTYANCSSDPASSSTKCSIRLADYFISSGELKYTHGCVLNLTTSTEDTHIKVLGINRRGYLNFILQWVEMRDYTVIKAKYTILLMGTKCQVQELEYPVNKTMDEISYVNNISVLKSSPDFVIAISSAEACNGTDKCLIRYRSEYDDNRLVVAAKPEPLTVDLNRMLVYAYKLTDKNTIAYYVQGENRLNDNSELVHADGKQTKLMKFHFFTEKVISDSYHEDGFVVCYLKKRSTTGGHSELVGCNKYKDGRLDASYQVRLRSWGRLIATRALKDKVLLFTEDDYQTGDEYRKLKLSILQDKHSLHYRGESKIFDCSNQKFVWFTENNDTHVDVIYGCEKSFKTGGSNFNAGMMQYELLSN